MRNVMRALVATVVAAMFLPLAAARSQDTTRSARRDSMHTDSVTRLHAVTVTAAPAERAQPVGATHVTGADIRLTPANTPYELLRQKAGVEVHEQGQGPGFASDASLRGFSSDHATDIALWVDGVPINEPINGHAEGYNDWSVMFPGGIQDIDVLHGPTSALFGNFALAGAINVRTLERMRGTEITATSGSFGRADAMIMSGFDHGTDGGVIGAHYQRADGFRPNSRYDVAHAHARLVHDLKPGLTIDGGAEVYSGHWDSPGFLSEDEFAAHDYSVASNPTDGGYKRRAQERVSLRMLAGNAIWRTTAYATQGRWQLFLTIPPAGGQFEGTGSQTEEEDARAGAGATSALTWSLPMGEATVGAETRWDRAHYENYFTTTRRRDSIAALVIGRQLLAAPFLQSSFNPSDRLRIDIGARYDAINTRSMPDSGESASATHAVFSPKLGTLFRIVPAIGVYANVSRGFRSSDGVITDPSLSPITEWAYETGVKVDRAGARASAALFRADVDNEQTFNPVTLESSNGGASRRQGLEVDWRVPAAAGAVTTDGEWTFTDARYRSLVAVPEEGGAPIVLNGLRVFNTSKYVGAVGVELAIPSTSYRIRVAGNWVGPYSPFDRPGVVLPGYGLAHVSAEWNVGKFVIDAGMRNVFDRAYPELAAGRLVAPGQPRTMYVSVQARLSDPR
jgi:outer membrane receptor protein involved in Fe transport